MTFVVAELARTSASSRDRASPRHQRLRGVRRLDEASARLLDEILEVTDSDPSSEIRVTTKLLERSRHRA